VTDLVEDAAPAIALQEAVAIGSLLLARRQNSRRRVAQKALRVRESKKCRAEEIGTAKK
jgi:hypothetical protein